MIGAVEDVAEPEETPDATVAEKRACEAHDIIRLIAAILAMEEDRDEGGGDEGGGENGNGEAGNGEEASTEPENDALREEPWNGKLDGETIELKEDDEE